MIFSSYRFIFVFLPIVCGVYALLNTLKLRTVSKVWLVLASLYFYSQGSQAFVPIFLFTIVFNFIIGHSILKIKESNIWIRRLILSIGILENLFLLGYYKYAYFIVDNYNRITSSSYTLHKIILPIGISFFTFQLIAYIVDCYKGQAKSYSFLDYLLFITFFPQLIVGPIVHHSDMVVQFEEEKNFHLNKELIVLGLFTFIIGIGKKILIADPLIVYAQSYYNGAASGFFESWTAVLSYTFAYYFDFSGYGDMAIGIGLLFNIHLPINFNSPYKARNFADFWKRWNITLSNFLNDYVFKSVYKFGDRAFKLFLGVMVTFVVSGLWHGAGWHFVAWGLVNGVFVCMAYVMILNNKALPFPIAWAITFMGVLLSRVLFDSHNLSQAMGVYKQMFQLPESFLSQGKTFLASDIYILLLIVLSAMITFGFKNTNELTEDFKPSLKTAIWAGGILSLSLFRMGEVSSFLYFQF